VLAQHAWQRVEGLAMTIGKCLNAAHGKSAWKFRIPAPRHRCAHGAIHGDRTDGQAFAFGQTSVALRVQYP